MKKNIDKNIDSLHPSDSELADYIADKLDSTKKSEIVKHLIECDECSDIVALIKRYGDKEVIGIFEDNSPVSDCSNEPTIIPKGGGDAKAKHVNNLFYSKRVRAIVLSGVVASLLISLITKSTLEQFSIGKINLSTPIIMTMSSSSKYQNRIVDGDSIVKEIEKKLNKTALSNFVKAQKAESQKDYDEAINLYKKSFRDAIKTFEGREKLRWQIVIYYHISKIQFETEDENSDSYKKHVQFWIQQYSLGGKE